MSGFPYAPPINDTIVFNGSSYRVNETLSIADANATYMKLSGGSVSGSTTFRSGLSVIGSASINIPAGGDLLTLTSTATSARSCVKFITDAAAWECGTRGSTAVYPNSFFLFNGGWRFVINSVGDTLITSDTSSTNKTTGALTVIGGIGCGGQITASRVRIESSTSHLTLANGVSNSLLEQVSSTDILRIVRGFALNVGSSGIRIQSGSTDAARFPIDLGNVAADTLICLSQSPGSNPIYGIGANNVNMIYSSGGGHRWTRSTSGTIGNDLMSLASDGVLRVTHNVVSDRGLFIKRNGFSGSGREGQGLAMHFATPNSWAEIFAYDYDASQFRDIRIGNTIYIGSQNQFVGIGTGTTAPTYPLAVSGNFNTSFGGAYGYIGPGGAGTGVGTGACNVTAYFQHRVWCSEVNAFSDRRLKENITDMDADDAVEFVRSVSPKNYNWKSDTNKSRCSGYVAQDVLKHGKFPELVVLGPDADLQEEIDDDGFVSPKGQRFLVSYQNAVPVLHKALAASFECLDAQQERLDAQQIDIDELRELLKLAKRPTRKPKKRRVVMSD